MPGLVDTDPLFRDVDQQLHKLWTWAVGLPGYDKKAWRAMEDGILKLAKRAQMQQPSQQTAETAWRALEQGIFELAQRARQLQQTAETAAGTPQETP